VSIEFWITTVVITATPGTGAIFTMAAGLSHGVRAGLVAALGCTLGIVPHLAATVTGAALLLASSPTAFAVLKWAGVAYLLYMAWSVLRSADDLTGPDATPPGAARTIRSAVLVNLLNPKLTLFFLAFLPQFVDEAGGDPVPTMLGLGAAFMAVTLAVFSLYGACAGTVRARIVTRPRVMAWLRRVFAVSFVALGARLALVQQ
jgi:threonine/homoserine/homoserine lactone efflux protein